MKVILDVISLATAVFLTWVFSKWLYEAGAILLGLLIKNDLNSEMMLMNYLFVALWIVGLVICAILAVISAAFVLFFVGKYFCMLFNIDLKIYRDAETKKPTGKYTSKYTNGKIKFL